MDGEREKRASSPAGEGDVLASSEALLNAMGRMAKVGGWAIDAETMQVTWTEEIYRIHEVPIGQIPPLQQAIEFFHPDDRTRLREAIDKALSHGEPYDMVIRFTSAKGKRLWTHTVCQPQVIDGKVVRLVGTFQDVTARRRDDDRLQRLQIAIDQSAGAVMITDTKGTIQYVNPAFERTSGYSREETLGQTPRLLKSGEHLAAFYEDFWNTIKGGQVWAGRFTNRRKDGTTYIDESTVSPVRSDVGEVVGYVAVMRDVTEELQLAEEFRQAQKMESVGRLAGGIAHDFNNLLTVICASSDMALDDLRDDDPLREDLEAIASAGKRAVALTRQLLAFSRRQVLKPEILDLCQILDGLSKMVQRLIGEDVALCAKLTGNGCWCRADAGQIEQVVLNLAVNARDAMPKGGTLTIECETVDLDEPFTRRRPGLEPGSYVKLAVSDDGTGMAEDTRRHIFEPFFTTKAAGKGTGLGLSTVHGIILQSGGHIFVTSELGVGTTFEIYLPQVAEAPVGREAGVVSDAPAAGAETVLVVEDDILVRRIAVRVLQRAGYTVLQAGDGAEALALCDHGVRFDLLLTDVVMPGASGPEVAERIIGRQGSVRVLFMSGYTDEAISNRLPDLNSRLLTKPFTADSLLRAVRQALT